MQEAGAICGTCVLTDYVGDWSAGSSRKTSNNITREDLMKSIACIAALATLLPGIAAAQTAQELIDGPKNSKNVVNFGMGYDLQRFSSLDQINKQNVKTLRPVWSYSLENTQSQESQPLVYNGVLFVSTEKATMAVDAKSGRQIWKVALDYAPETYRMACCGANSRGVALYDGKVFRAALDKPPPRIVRPEC
jgi:alcohol dehydrogenase (cytochrome c)